MDFTKKHCVPCEGGVDPYTGEQIEEYRKVLDSDWQVVDNKKLKREFHFESYMAGAKFTLKVAELADSEDHHPDMTLFYKRVEVILTTHAIGGLSENDFIIASKIDLLNRDYKRNLLLIESKAAAGKTPVKE